METAITNAARAAQRARPLSVRKVEVIAVRGAAAVHVAVQHPVTAVRNSQFLRWEAMTGYAGDARGISDIDMAGQ